MGETDDFGMEEMAREFFGIGKRALVERIRKYKVNNCGKFPPWIPKPRPREKNQDWKWPRKETKKFFKYED